jgi:hypothetical protein
MVKILYKNLILGFPQILAEAQAFNLECIVMPLYGRSLKDVVITRRDRKFSLKTTCLIGI